MENNIIKFLKSKDYTAIRDIGQGGTGKTKLIKDETINETFVCKNIPHIIRNINLYITKTL